MIASATTNPQKGALKSRLKKAGRNSERANDRHQRRLAAMPLDTIDTATSLNNLALLLQDQGDYAAAGRPINFSALCPKHNPI